MRRCLHLARLLLTWTAMLAYVSPGAIHAMQGGHHHVAAVSPGTCEAAEPAHARAHHHEPVTDGHAAMARHHGEKQVPSKACETTPQRDAGLMSCCVAMCTPALPVSALPDLVAAHYGCEQSSFDRSGTRVALATRLERPPK